MLQPCTLHGCCWCPDQDLVAAGEVDAMVAPPPPWPCGWMCCRPASSAIDPIMLSI